MIRDERGRYLISQRLPTGTLADLWEFPGGKPLPDETLEDCCVREIREELGIEIAVGSRIAAIEHRYPEAHVTLHFYHAIPMEGEPRAIECQDWRWVEPGELADYAFPPADAPLLGMLTPDEGG